LEEVAQQLRRHAQSLMQAQLGLVSGLAKEHPDFKGALDATDSERLKEKVKI